MILRALVAGILCAPSAAALAGGYLEAAGASPADRAGVANLAPRHAGVLPVDADTQVGYDLRIDRDAALNGNITTLYKLSRTDMLNLRLEKQDGRAYWLRRQAGGEQRAGLFGASFGGVSERVIGWQYAKGYPVAGETLPTDNRVKPWAESLRPTGELAVPPDALAPDLFGNRPVVDEVGRKARTGFTDEYARVRQVFRPEPLLANGRRDYKLALGSAPGEQAAFAGGELRGGLTKTWTMEAGGYVDDAPAVYARSRLRLGPGLLKLEARNDDGLQHGTQRAAYHYRNAALALEQQDATRNLRARMIGGGYYAAFDHGLGGDGGNRVAAGYSTSLGSSRVSMRCEAKSGAESSRYCGVGWLIPLHTGPRQGAPSTGVFAKLRGVLGASNFGRAGGFQ